MHAKDTEGAPGGHPGGPGHETRDVSVGIFAGVVIGLVLITLVGMGISWWYVRFEAEQAKKRDTPASPLAATLPAMPPEPRLQVTPATDLQRYRSEEEEILNGYAWVDATGGIVRIPIDRAIEILAERGLPARAPGEQNAAPAVRPEAKKGTR